MRFSLLFVIISMAYACKKEPATEIDPAFQGDWIHYESVSKFKEIHIYQDNKGYIWYSEGWSTQGDTRTRKWLIKNDFLYFGWTANGNEKFKIDRYPTIADSSFIAGFDTIAAGTTYIILDDDLFCNCL